MVNGRIQHRKELKKLKKMFAVSLSDMKRIVGDFHSEMSRGLKGRRSSLKMIPTYVGKPRGSEKGRFIALDFGGTNFRVLGIHLKGKGRSGIFATRGFVLDKKYLKATSRDFFSFIARCIRIFVTANRLNTGEGCDLGFTFSFPVEQTAIASGILVKWTKGFNVKGVLRKDVVGFLNAALADEGLGSIKVAALVNDTVGTLMARSYEDTYCDAGMIVGTGTNACYLEKSAAISKWKGPRPQAEYTIVNTEWGNFDKLRRTAYDKTLDEISDRPGEQILEKMVSGLYLGEITRLILKDLAKRQVLSGRGSSSRLAEKWVLKSEYMSAIESDRTAALRETANILAELGVRNTTKYDREFVRMICHLISLRAARLIAAALGAVVTKMDPDLRGRHTVAVDGAVYERHPQFANDIRRALRELFGKKGLGIKPVLTKDGSGKGAAIAAAVTVCAERR